jgi:tartrate dehydrogenase/decarboxylase / D-malate dehydrogenase
MKTFRIATIPGDGIGKEVVPEGIRALEKAGRKHGFSFEWNTSRGAANFTRKLDG